MASRRPVLLAILDGYGLSPAREGNSIALARKPTLDRFLEKFPHTRLEASGLRVGLPEGQIGNSEVGHLNIGAGRVVCQDITQIDEAISDGSFFANAALSHAMQKGRQTSLHLLGLVSDGGVHSHLRHLKALLDMAARQKVDRVFIHAFTDGRDTSPYGGAGCVRDLTDHIGSCGGGQIATICGRYYAMDRDRRWERTQKAYDAIVLGVAEKNHTDPAAAIEQSYREQVTDEFIKPCVLVTENGQPRARLTAEDSVLFFNFRADRARQLTAALTQDNFEGFPRRSAPVKHFVSMTRYDERYNLARAFEPLKLDSILASVCAAHGLKNLRIAETEKYAHVSYFFNGGEEPPFPDERRVLIPSPKVPTYDLKPEMSAVEITDRLIIELQTAADDCIILNFANADMVGHTGVIPAAVKAVETVDACLARIASKISDLGGVLMVTADHGNAEQMIDPQTGGPHTAHTSNPVPFVLVDSQFSGKLRPGGALEDIAPTILELFGVEKPKAMTGRSLLQ